MKLKKNYRFFLYNIRYGTGSGWKFHTPIPFSGYLRKTKKVLPKIITLIKSYRPDIVGLIEVDGGSRRSGGKNQAKLIAEGLGHYFIFEKKYKNAMLYRHMPIMKNQGNALLAGKEILNQHSHYFERGIKRLIIEVEFEDMVFFLVHLSIKYAHRQEQLKSLSKLIKQIQKPIIVSGDFNTFLGQWELNKFLQSTNLKSANAFNHLTFPSKKPRWELDFIFHSTEITIHNINVPRVRLSDHLPLVCDFTLNT